jgi:hypothetical protein
VNSSNMVKIIAAFVGGIIVALGCALIYVKANDRNSQHALVQTAPPSETAPPEAGSLPDADRSPSAAANPPANQEAAPPPAAKPAAKRPVNSSVGHRYQHNNEPAAPVRQQPVQTAQNAPPPAASPAPNPYDTAAPARPAPPANPAPDDTPAPAAAPPPPVRQPRTVTIPAGTNIAIRLGETLSTEHNYTGDTFRGTLDAPLVLDGAIIADRGSKVLGKIVSAEKAGRVKGTSDLTLALTELSTTDGQRVAIQTSSLDRQGAKGTGKDAAKVGGGAALGAIIGAIAGGGKGAGIGAGVGGAAGAGDVLLTRGKPVVLASETKLSFRLAAPVSITERLSY